MIKFRLNGWLLNSVRDSFELADFESQYAITWRGLGTTRVERSKMASDRYGNFLSTVRRGLGTTMATA
jgi:hypothetical protein